MDLLVICTQMLCFPFYPCTISSNFMLMSSEAISSCRDFVFLPVTFCQTAMPAIGFVSAAVALLPNVLNSMASSFEAVERITNVVPQACLDLLIAVEKLFSEIVYWIK